MLFRLMNILSVEYYIPLDRNDQPNIDANSSSTDIFFCLLIKRKIFRANIIHVFVYVKNMWLIVGDEGAYRIILTFSVLKYICSL